MRHHVYKVAVDRLKFVGALTTLLGIALATLSVLMLMDLSLGEQGVVLILSFWLGWFLLRAGLPPSVVLISELGDKIGLQNALCTRWFDLKESRLESIGPDDYLLIIDNRTLSLASLSIEAVALIEGSRQRYEPESLEN